MADNPCTICGAPLSLKEGRAFCSNDECSSGGLFLRCGYCRRYSFSIHPDQMSCSNSSCHMTGVKRSYCQHCGKTSEVSIFGQSICVNRNCKSNAKVIGHCFFCGKKAFLKIPEIMVCTKGDCPYILKRMEPCFHCKAIAFDFKGKVCRSAECEYHEVKIGSCSTCGVVSRILRQDHEHAEKCSNKKCADYYDAPPTSPPAAAPQGRPLKGVVSEKDATQIIREKVLATETELDVPIQSIEDEEPQKSPPAPPPQHGDDFEIALPRSITKPREPPTRVSPSGRLVPVAPPEAPPPTPSRFAPAGMLERPSTEESLRSVFQFLRDHVLTDEKGARTALFTVVGLSGSGKTTYLSALGDILAHRGVRYHYPWSGVDVKRFDVEKVIEERSQSGADSSRLPSAIDVHPLLKDLAFDFASEQISGFLSKGQWARPSEETQFLVAQLARRGKVIARIVSIETEGKEYDSTLKNIRDRVRGKDGGSHIQGAIADLLGRAEGIVILLDPANDENGKIYLDVFRLLGESVSTRAIERFRGAVKQRLGTRARGGEKGKKVDQLLNDVLRDGDEKPRKSTADETMLIDDGSTELRFRIGEAIKEVRGEHDLPPDLPLVSERASKSHPGPSALENLKHVAVVITKSDMHPVISPADRYPDQKLPKCRPAIAALDGYLRLCGGGIRFYNASATGHTILKDTLYYPAAENTLTPINIAEPIFDMLERR